LTAKQNSYFFFCVGGREKMSNKRSKRAHIQKFHCPYCESRLWRLGGQRHFLYYSNATEILQNLDVTRKRATLIATQGAYIDRLKWIEEFFCGEHGKLWLRLHQKEEGLISKLASDEDWKSSTGTIDPNAPNPSVSEFTYRMSRRQSNYTRYHG
jgi:hypothetical protein